MGIFERGQRLIMRKPIMNFLRIGKNVIYDYSKTPELSDLARANLREWYRQDYQFLKYCEHWLVQERGRPPCNHYSSFT